MGGADARVVLKGKSNKMPGIRFHQIIAVIEMRTDTAAQKPRMTFVLAQRKKTEEDKYMSPITNM